MKIEEERFEINWADVKNSPLEITNAMFYLLQVMEISINKERYNLLTPEGKRYFKLKE
jgi:hypothetical protein